VKGGRILDVRYTRYNGMDLHSHIDKSNWKSNAEPRVRDANLSQKCGSALLSITFRLMEPHPKGHPQIQNKHTCTVHTQSFKFSPYVQS